LLIARKKLSGITEEALSRYALRARRAVGLEGSVEVLLTGNDEMRELNRRFRRKNKPTDVLSFPAADPNGTAGDIAISVDIAADNAERLGHSLAVEIKILMLHGMLHLAGYDHEHDNGEMARKEHKLRAELKLPDGLIARAAASRNTRRKR
jgi:probable rRNA maturation factor